MANSFSKETTDFRDLGVRSKKNHAMGHLSAQVAEGDGCVGVAKSSQCSLVELVAQDELHYGVTLSLLFNIHAIN